MSQPEQFHNPHSPRHNVGPLPRPVLDSDIDPQLLNGNQAVDGGERATLEVPDQEQWFDTLN